MLGYLPYILLKYCIYTCFTNCSVQVKIASGQERVSLQLKWGNGAINYSLDENSEDDVKCRSPHNTGYHALPLDHSLPWQVSCMTALSWPQAAHPVSVLV